MKILLLLCISFLVMWEPVHPMSWLIPFLPKQLKSALKSEPTTIWSNITATRYLNDENYADLDTYLQEHLLDNFSELALDWVNEKAHAGCIPMMYYAMRYWVYFALENESPSYSRHAFKWAILTTILTKADIDCCLQANLATTNPITTFYLIQTNLIHRLKQFYDGPVKTTILLQAIDYQKILNEALECLKSIKNQTSPGWVCTAHSDLICTWIHFKPITLEIRAYLNLNSSNKGFSSIREASFKQTINELKQCISWTSFFSMKYKPLEEQT